MPLHSPPQRPRAERRIVTNLCQPLPSRVRQRDPQAPLLKPLLNLSHHQVHDLQNLLPAQRLEHDDLVDAIDELRPERLFQRLINRPLQVLERLRPARPPQQPDALPLQNLRPKIGRHDDDRVAEIHRPAVPVRQPPVLQNLEEHVEHVRVRLLDLVEQNDSIRPTPHQLRQLTAVVVPDIPGWRADQPRHLMPFAVLGHIQPNHRLLVPKQELRQRARQLRLADTRRPQEDETPDGTLRVLESRPRPPNRVGQRRNGLLLPDDAPMQLRLHSRQPQRLLLQHSAHGHPGPLGDKRRDVLRLHRVSDALLLLPRRKRRLILVLQLRPRLLDPRRLLEILTLRRCLVLDLKLTHPLIHLFQLRRERLRIDPQPRPRLIDKVDGLVRQLPIRDVPRAQPHRRLQRLRRNRHPVMRLIARRDALQNPDRVLHGRLLDINGLEAPLQRRVLLDVPAILIQRRRAHRLQLAPRQRRLEHVGRVHRALRRPRAHDRMQLIDEQHDVAVRMPHLVQHVLQTLLKLATELRARHQRPHIQRMNTRLAQPLRHVSRDDSLRQPLSDGRLANARLADDHRIVLGAARQDLHHALNLHLPTDNRIQLAILGQLRQIDGVLVQCSVRPF